MLRGVELNESCTRLLSVARKLKAKIERSIEEKIIEKTTYYKDSQKKEAALGDVAPFEVIAERKESVGA